MRQALRALMAVSLLGAGAYTSTAEAQTCPCSLWGTGATPGTTTDSSAGEYGVKFTADVDGNITGIRFYKAIDNTGTHTGNLWTTSGTLLGTVVFTGETVSGWQQANFTSPIAVTAGTTYIASYFTSTGHYAYDFAYFNSAFDNAPLHALVNTVSGPNGVYLYSSQSAFPTQTYGGSNYWVDVVFSPTGAPVSPTVTSTTPGNGAGGVAANATVTATFNVAVDPATITGSTFQLRDSTGTTISGTVTYDNSSRTARLQPALALVPGTTYTAVLKGGVTDPTVRALTGTAMAANYTWSFTTGSNDPNGCPCSLWPVSTIPLNPDSGDATSTELGLRFRSDVSGYITGIRFYKSVLNNGTHIGNIWTTAGALLGTVTFTGETASGWQQADFPAPLQVTAGTTYIVSYFAPGGHYAYQPAYFSATGVDAGPLHAPANGVDGNGIYSYGPFSAFPASTFNASNYWVDIVFSTLPGTAPTVTAVTPANGASGINTTTAVTATFSAPIAPATINSSTFQLRTSAGSTVTATVSYNSTNQTATLQPSAALSANSTYTAILTSFITSDSGAQLASSVTWSFSTTAASQPPTVTAVTPLNGSTNVPANTLVTATFSKALNSATVNSATFKLVDPSNNVVTAAITYNAGNFTATLQPTAALSYSTTYRALLPAGGVTDSTGTPLASNVSWSFTTGAAPPPPPTNCPCNIWSATTAPTTNDSGENASVELGVKFRTDVSGLIVGIRFYKSVANGGTHIGKLWASNGTLLSSATFTDETGSGWQQVMFTTPVAVTSGTTYIASYFAPQGHYAFDEGTFTSSAVDRAPLHALGNGVDGPNGVFFYGPTGGFPNSSYNSSNYWVDVVYLPNSSTAAPAVVATVPTANATGIGIGTTISAVFNEPLDSSSISQSTMQVRDSNNNLVAGTVTYIAAAAKLVFTPTTTMLSQTQYTVTVAANTRDIFGNTMTAPYTWSFTTTLAPANSGPGGPVLVIASAQNPYTRYYGEILLNEGLNAFTVQDVSTVSATTLNNYDVVILAEMQLTSSQVSMLTTWVNNGGRLIAMRPDKQLASLLGISVTSNTLSNAYLAVNSTSGPGVGIVADTIQFHGTADLYTLSGATSYATLYSGPSSPTASPAVTWMAVGAGQAAAFTYDLARSVALTRQGNPAWSGQDRDAVIDPSIGNTQIRANDLFYGAASFDPQPEWVNLDKVAIPQADEQQRFLINLLQQMNQAKKPLPRFWYLPKGYKAAVIMTGDDHNLGGTSGRFDNYLASSPAGCSVSDWTCIRATSYIWPHTPVPNYASYVAQGFEIALHVDNFPSCTTFTPESLDSAMTGDLALMTTNYPSLPVSKTNRNHCVLWSDYDTVPQLEFKHGIRLDTSYYYWPDTWVQDRPGMFTGSGMPMRFTDRNGNIIDVYQATTQMPDETNQTFPYTIDMLLDNALGPKGFYGVFTANMHTDQVASSGSDAILTSALARGVPIVSSLQMLTWLDGRNNSYFSSIAWNGSVLNFNVVAATGSTNLMSVLPAFNGNTVLQSITRNGTSVSFTLQTIKGVAYAMFSAPSGSYVATYATAYTISGTITGPGASGAIVNATGPATATATTDAAGHYTLTGLFSGTYTVTPVPSGYTYTPTNRSLTISSANVTGIDFTSAIGTSTPLGTDTIQSADNDVPDTSIAIDSFSTGSANQLLLAFVSADNPGFGGATVVSGIAGGGLTWQLVQRTNAQLGTAEIWRAFATAQLNAVPITATFSTSVRSSITVVSFTGVDRTGVNGSGAIGAVGTGNGPNGAPTASLTTTRAASMVFGVGVDWDHNISRTVGSGQTLVHQFLSSADGTYWVQRVNNTVPLKETLATINDTAPTSDRYNLSIVEILAPVHPAAVGLSPSSVTFPAQLLNTTSAGSTVTLSNTGDTNLTINSITITGTNASNFAQTNNCGTLLAGGASCTVTLTFTPSVTGTHTASLSISDNASGSPHTVSLTGTGTAVSVSPAGIAFGNQNINTNSTAQVVTLTNLGSSTLSSIVISFTGSNTGDFSQTNNCGTSRPANSNCTINITFRPRATGNRSATLRITDSDPSSPQQVTLTGVGTTPVASLSPTSHNFGTLAINTTSAPSPVTLSNTGTGPMTITSITFTGTGASNYAQTNNCGTTVSAGANCTINVTFTPSATGSRTASLSIADDASGSPHTVSLSGTGTAVSVSPASIAFGNQNLNTNSTAQVVTLTNLGSSTLSSIAISFTGSNTGDFSQTNNCGTSRPANSTCTINVTFRPTVIGNRSATLRIANSDPTSPQQVALTGTGLGASASLSPTSVAFGSQAVNVTSAARVVTLQNTGNLALTITSITITGTNASNFAQTNTCGTSVAAGSSCTISATFTPSSSGAKSASISIADSASGSPHTVSVSGTGLTVTVSPSSLNFGSRSIFASGTSSPQTVTLTNVGTTTLTSISISITGTNSSNFAQTNNCGTSRPAGTGCTISITFDPSATGSRSATLRISDSDPSSPQQVTLSGTGTLF